jgi:putative spermidine/putrescine transport system substrate-binding protein
VNDLSPQFPAWVKEGGFAEKTNSNTLHCVKNTYSQKHILFMEENMSGRERISRISRRDFLKVAGMTGMSAYLAACAKATVAPPPAQPTVDLLASGNAIPMDQLVTLAKAEGQLTVIALPHDWANYGKMIEDFKAKYGLTVNELNPDASSGDEIQAIDANKKSKGPQAPDAVDVGLGFVDTSTQQGLFAKYKVSTWDTIADSVKNPDGFWYCDYYGLISFEGNMDVIKTMPTDWPDLLKPEFKGKISLQGDPASSGVGSYTVWAAGYARTGKLDDDAAMEGMKYFAEMKAAGNLLPTDASNSTVAKGETPLIMDWNYLALANKDELKGNPPIEVVVPKTGIVAGPYAQAISAYAPHPYAARLWMEYMYSDEGQLTWLSGYAYPIRYNDLAKRNVIPADLAAKLPPAELAAQAAFPTIPAVNSAKKIIAENWRKIVYGEG